MNLDRFFIARLLVPLSIIGCTYDHSESTDCVVPDTTPVDILRVEPIIRGDTIQLDPLQARVYLENRFVQEVDWFAQRDVSYLFRLDSICDLIMPLESVPNIAQWYALHSVVERLKSIGWNCIDFTNCGISSAKSAIVYADSIGDSELRSRAVEQLGYSYSESQKFDSALYSFRKCLEELPTNSEEHARIWLMLSMGDVLVELGRTGEAFTTMAEVRAHAQQCSNVPFQLQYSETIGKLFARVNQPDSATYYFGHGLDLSRVYRDTINELGFIYRLGQQELTRGEQELTRGEYDDVLAYFRIARNLLRGIPIRDGRHTMYLLFYNEILTLAGFSHIQMGQYEEALDLFVAAHNSAPGKKIDYARAKTYLGASICHVALGNAEMAIDMSSEAIKYANKSKVPTLIMLAYGVMSDAAELNGDYRQALYNFKEAIQRRDSINPIHVYTDFISDQQQYEFRLDRAVDSLNHHHEKMMVVQQKESEKRKWIWGLLGLMVGLTIALLTAGGLFYRKQRTKWNAILETFEIRFSKLKSVFSIQNERHVRKVARTERRYEKQLKQKNEEREQVYRSAVKSDKDIMKLGLTGDARSKIQKEFDRIAGTKVKVSDEEWERIRFLMLNHDRPVEWMYKKLKVGKTKFTNTMMGPIYDYFGISADGRHKKDQVINRIKDLLMANSDQV